MPWRMAVKNIVALVEFQNFNTYLALKNEDVEVWLVLLVELRNGLPSD